MYRSENILLIVPKWSENNGRKEQPVFQHGLNEC